jgi:hypothetical protein
MTVASNGQNLPGWISYLISWSLARTRNSIHSNSGKILNAAVTCLKMQGYFYTVFILYWYLFLYILFICKVIVFQNDVVQTAIKAKIVSLIPKNHAMKA